MAKEEMMSFKTANGHRETWKVWLREISPLKAKDFDWRVQLLDDMAEALSIASPHGPKGVSCVDPCRCDDNHHQLVIRRAAELDLVGKNVKLPRKKGEADESYRRRLHARITGRERVA